MTSHRSIHLVSHNVGHGLSKLVDEEKMLLLVVLIKNRDFLHIHRVVHVDFQGMERKKSSRVVVLFEDGGEIL